VSIVFKFAANVVFKLIGGGAAAASPGGLLRVRSVANSDTLSGSGWAGSALMAAFGGEAASAIRPAEMSVGIAVSFMQLF